tara:strand:- start:176 stop:652 length:477 start_codon:yes stop_codon:yes gene_type:complete
MKRTLLLGAFVSALLIGFVSCKKCTVAEEDTISGIIIPNTIVYAMPGYLTRDHPINVWNGQQYDGFGYNFEISIDEGVTRIPVDYDAYTILANPMYVNCKASFEKSVTRDDINNIVRYKITATTCKSCEQERYVENYILVPDIPSNYTVVIEKVINVN